MHQDAPKLFTKLTSTEQPTNNLVKTFLSFFVFRKLKKKEKQHKKTKQAKHFDSKTLHSQQPFLKTFTLPA
jgi:hypothetical protein